MPDWLKNPYVLGGGAFLFVLLILMGKSGGGSNASTMIASQKLATDANIALAGDTTRMNLAGAQYQRDTALRAYDVGLAAHQSDVGLMLGTFSFLNNQTKSDVLQTTTLAAINAKVSMNATNDATNLALENSRINGVLALQPSIERIAITRANDAMNTAVQVAQIQATARMDIANTQADAATNAALIGLGSSAIGAVGGGALGFL